jgi:hypothetical protein
MLGPMDAAAKTKRVAAQRRKKDVIAEAVRPDDVVVGGEDQQETDRNMNSVYKVVIEHEGCLMTDLVLNFQSFAQTVENLFALSFLVRDRRVKLSESDEGVRVYKAPPLVRKKKNKDKGGDADDGVAGANVEDDNAERFQFVITFNEDTWNLWKGVTNVEDTLMPHREHAPPPQQQQQQQRGGAGRSQKRRSEGEYGSTPSGKRRG